MESINETKDWSQDLKCQSRTQYFTVKGHNYTAVGIVMCREEKALQLS